MFKINKAIYSNLFLLGLAIIGFVGYSYEWINMLLTGEIKELTYREWRAYVIVHLICIFFLANYIKLRLQKK